MTATMAALRKPQVSTRTGSPPSRVRILAEVEHDRALPDNSAATPPVDRRNDAECRGLIELGGVDAERAGDAGHLKIEVLSVAGVGMLRGLDGAARAGGRRRRQGRRRRRQRWQRWWRRRKEVGETNHVAHSPIASSRAWIRMATAVATVTRRQIAATPSPVAVLVKAQVDGARPHHNAVAVEFVDIRKRRVDATNRVHGGLVDAQSIYNARQLDVEVLTVRT